MSMVLAVETLRAAEAAASMMLRTAEVRAAELGTVTLRTATLEAGPLESMEPMDLRAVAVHGVMTMIEHPLELIPAPASNVGLLRAGVGAAWPFVTVGALVVAALVAIGSLSFRRAHGVVRRSRTVFVHGMVLAHHFGAARIEARLEVGFVAGLELRLARFLRLRVLLLQQLFDAL